MQFLKLTPLALIILFATGCPVSEAVEVDPRMATAERLLTRYIQTDTSNPGGSYDSAVALLRETLHAAGIESRVLRCSPDGPPAVYARIEGGHSGGDLLLLHHMDVVPADSVRWSVPPFSGEKKGGYIWGRGAIDDKSLGVAHLEAFVDLYRRQSSLRRGAIFLAVPDEERGGMLGAACLLDAHPALFSEVGVVLGEGGSTDTAVDRVRVWSIEVQQKVPVWLRVRVTGRGGHGASHGDEGAASERLIEVLSDVRRDIALNQTLLPEAAAMFEARARASAGSRRAILSHPEATFEDGRLLEAAGSWESVLRDSFTITTLAAGDVVNSVPAEAFGEIDARLLPTTSPEVFVNSFRRVVGDRAEVEVLHQGQAAPASPVSHPIYRLLESMLPAAERGSIVAPAMIAGATDSRYFRLRGIPSYGFSPFKVNYYDAAGIHGDDERIRVQFFHEGVSLMREIVARYCLNP